MRWKLAFFVLLTLGLLFGLWASIRLGGWQYLTHRLITLEPWPAYQQAQSQQALLKSARCELILLGDSHVAQGLWHEWLPGLSVANRGISGDDVPGAINRLPTIAFDNARTVVIQLGTNDLLNRAPEAVFADYLQLLGQLGVRTAAKILVTTLPGVNDEVRWTSIDAARVAELNVLLRQLPTTHPQVQILDLAVVTAQVPGVLRAELTADGVHLHGEGYRLWAELIGEALADSSGKENPFAVD